MHNEISHFLTFLKTAKNASEHTIRNYSIDLNAFFSFCSTPLQEMERSHVREYLAWLHCNQFKRKTVLRRLSSLRSFFKYALAQKWISNNPCEDMDSPKNEKLLPVSLSYEQVCRLLEQPDIQTLLGWRDRTLMEIIYSSGLRVSEVAGLNKADFYPEELLIRVKGKGKKERVIPITKNSSTWILGYLNHPDRAEAEQDPHALFLNCHGKRLTTRSIDRNFEKYLEQSGLSGKITPHTIRHTIATHWLENGMNLKTIQTLLGHTCLATTTIYTQVSPKLKKEVYDRTHPRA